VKYLKDNPGSFENEDQPGILAYTLIMVNAMRNQPGMMNKDLFISMCEEIHKPTEYLSAMYDRMIAEEVCVFFF
jgi:Sec7-like guanine-nucleotide exchange factor